MNEIKLLKHFLESAFYWHNRKEYLSWEILKLKSQAEKATASYQDVPIFGSYKDHRQDVMDEMADRREEYREAVEECKKQLQAIKFFIDCLDSYKERTVLEFRYLYFLHFKDIADRLNYSIPNVQKLHDKGVEHLLKKHDEIIKNSGRRLF